MDGQVEVKNDVVGEGRNNSVIIKGFVLSHKVGRNVNNATRGEMNL